MDWDDRYLFSRALLSLAATLSRADFSASAAEPGVDSPTGAADTT